MIIDTCAKCGDGITQHYSGTWFSMTAADDCATCPKGGAHTPSN